MAAPEKPPKTSRQVTLENHPHRDEIVMRLRYGWSPRRVTDWLVKKYPKSPPILWRTLYRFLKDKPESWYLERLDALEVASGGVTREMPRLLVLDEQVRLIQAQQRRLRTALRSEEQLAATMAGGMPVLIPEIRANLDLLDRMLDRHMKLQQQLGLEPKNVPDEPEPEPQEPEVGQPNLAVLTVAELAALELMARRARGEAIDDGAIAAAMQAAGASSPPAIEGRVIEGESTPEPDA